MGSRSEGRRAIEQGGVAIDGEKITDVKYLVPGEKLDGGRNRSETRKEKLPESDNEIKL